MTPIRYYIGLNGSREPHPLSPEGGFLSAAEACQWAITHDLDPVWWPYDERERDPQPARLEGTP